MTQMVSKYYLRAARYVLQPQDNTLIRFAGPKMEPWEEGTEIKNISLTGLVFTAPHDLCPLVGEYIKIQFEIPGGERMACWSLITRIEVDSDNKKVRVATHFEKLSMPHRVMLAQSLAKRLKEQIEENQRNITSQFFQNISQNKLEFMNWGILLMSLLGLMWIFAKFNTEQITQIFAIIFSTT